MRNLSRLRDTTYPRWRSLLSALLTREDVLATTFMEQLESVPGYTSNQVRAEDLTTMAVRSYRLLLFQLLGVPLPDELQGLAEELGRTRAQQGVPLEDLAAAIRLDFPVLWSALLWLARESDMEVLSAHVDRLWGVVDDYATRARVAYLAERAVLARQAADEQHSLLTGLFATNGEQPALVAQTATALRLDPRADLWVVAAGPDHMGALGAALDALPSAPAGAPFTRFDAAGMLCAFGIESRSGTMVLGDLSVACGLVRDVPGLAALPEKARESAAVDALLAEADHRPRTIHEVWPRFVHGALETSFPAFLASLESELDRHTGEDDRRVLQTVRVFLATGSVGRTAEETFCHRNTVKNRLQQFARWTGLDPHLPLDAALAIIALQVLPRARGFAAAAAATQSMNSD